MKTHLAKITIIILLPFFTNAQKVIPLYEGKAPGSETWDWPESSKKMGNNTIAYNVTTPEITAYIPHALNSTGTAVIIAPGGAFHILSMDSEGVEVAKYLNSKGIAAFVLKYRLARIFTDDPFKEVMGKMSNFKTLDEENAPIIPLAMNDGFEAVKYVRSHAKEMNIDPNRIGMIGFSAGATVTMSVVYNANEEARPNFVAPIYAYENAIIGSNIPAQKTPIFVAVASNDQLGFMPQSINIYKKWQDAKQPAELHIYEKGGHGFGMNKTSITADAWPEHFVNWLKMQKLMPSPQPSSNIFQRAPSPNDTLVSTKIMADKKVIFSIYAPEAHEVTVSGDFPGGFPNVKLEKNNSGIWSYTTAKSLTPDVYTYDFLVDGIKTFDPKNSQFKESNNGFSNIFELTGTENDFQTLKNVPHGKVEIVNYISSALGGINRRLHVYLPPNYGKTKEKLPVLYLLHGGGDNDASWTTVGKANNILDNLYAENKLKPMIVVMPAGHVPQPGFFMGAGTDQDPFCNDLLTDIIPFIEKNYPVSTKREARAIAGLSMGGVQTLNLALWHPEKFGYVYPMSTGYFGPALKELEEKYSNILKNPAINQFKLFTIGMGKDDPLAYKNNKAMMEVFDKMGVNYNYVETDGGHTFLVWRKNLAHIAPLLFR
jgi:enterochelin esterase-like enzyme/acetyl esterase/lipase